MFSQIVSFSGGKDSTAMLLMMLEKGMQVDEIIFVDTTKEFPEIYRNITKVEAYIGRKVTKVAIDFDYWFKDIDHKSKDRNGYGWPTPKNRWCTGRKRGAFNQAAKGRKYDSHTQNRTTPPRRADIYLGIAADEPRRIRDIKNTHYPLAEWGITEAQALQYCYDHGFDFEGAYEHFRSLSCYLCPFHTLDQTEAVYNYYPEQWKDMLRLDDYAHNLYKNKYRIADLPAIFEQRRLKKKEE